MHISEFHEKNFLMRYQIWTDLEEAERLICGRCVTKCTVHVILIWSLYPIPGGLLLKFWGGNELLGPPTLSLYQT